MRNPQRQSCGSLRIFCRSILQKTGMQQERYTRNPEMAEIMSSWTKEELKSLAEDLELKGYHSLKKDILVWQNQGRTFEAVCDGETDDDVQ